MILLSVTDYEASMRATSIDVSEGRLQQAMERNRENSRVKFVCGDAQSMEFQSNSFDLVYCRMLLQYLREKERAVSEMVRVCKPGGTVLLQDLDGQLLWHYPEDPSVQRTLEKVVAALGATGFDQFVGRKLLWLAENAGLTNIDVKVECYNLIT